MRSQPRHPGDHYAVDVSVEAESAYDALGPRAFAALTGESTPAGLLVRWEGDPRESLIEAPRVYVGMQVWDALIAGGVSPESVRAWLVAPSPALGGVTPTAALRAGASRKEVLAAASKLFP